ncbi:UNVERIFIED_CONTAM: hypothetical protein GTU68_004875 [Idotea baltica]|nr:hypothetical protein [Idotea baltica]
MTRLMLKLLLPVLALIIGFFIFNEYQRFLSTPINVDENNKILTIQPGMNLNQVSQKLTEQGITDFPANYLSWYGRYRQSAHKIKAGEYQLDAQQTLPDLLALFITGKVIQHSFTIIEGMTSRQLFAAIAADKRFIKTLENYDLSTVMTQIDGNERHGEGEFAPETYYFSAGTTDIAFLKRAYDLLQKNLAESWLSKADNLPYKTPYEALIMASIIEKETGIAEERPEIAGVFVRRLNKGMRLQTDPTVIYGMGDKYDGNIRRKDLTTDTAYNTYTRYGLPPSPIALASKAAIHAALNPASGKSLYFVAKGQEGRHVFSNTLAEHNKAVRQYQLKK